ncbi:AGAP013397-PA-like protein [Anopheles sinensis]|uniref:AGAP013397-PA-like protein n=1 Tax=Anopheles sinensis TaxID=74873 RepID=A0A084VN39_ANOSI|nr:AGAP013397-PA-like protein [Anopheles sinensis]
MARCEPIEDTHFDGWSLKKSILNTLFQAVKAITGGVTAIKGQLIKGSGYLVSGAGKLIASGGDAVTGVGKKIALSAHLIPPKQASHPFAKLSGLLSSSSSGLSSGSSSSSSSSGHHHGDASGESKFQHSQSLSLSQSITRSVRRGPGVPLGILQLFTEHLHPSPFAPSLLSLSNAPVHRMRSSISGTTVILPACVFPFSEKEEARSIHPLLLFLSSQYPGGLSYP